MVESIDSNDKAAAQSAEPLSERLSKKDFAKKIRHEAYQRAKLRQKTDPRHIAMKERLRARQREAYQKAKIRKKSAKEGSKAEASSSADDARLAHDRELLTKVFTGNTLAIE